MYRTLMDIALNYSGVGFTIVTIVLDFQDN